MLMTSSGARGVVLIVEDNVESAELLADLVEAEGFRSLICGTASDGLHAHYTARPVAILLDWGLPDTPGTEVCRQVRARDAAIPIIFVSGRDDETSIARALDAGADDYVPKPVRGGELIARLEAHLRRVSALASLRSSPADAQGQAKPARFGNVEVDFAAHEVRSGGRPIRLGGLEFKLLEYLARNAGVAVSRDQILSEVYGYDADINSERVDLLVRRLRSKLGPAAQAHISTVAGFGYRLERRSDPATKAVNP